MYNLDMAQTVLKLVSTPLVMLLFAACKPAPVETVFGKVETPVEQPSQTTPNLPSSRGDAPAPPYPDATGVLVGSVYLLDKDHSDATFAGYVPVGKVSTDRLNIPNRSFEEGFPGITNRNEWFGIEYRGRCRFGAGLHQFRLASDDGSRLYLDEQPVIQNDGVHGEVSVAGKAMVQAGLRRVRVAYFQGPATEIALQLFVTTPGGKEEIFVCKP